MVLCDQAHLLQSGALHLQSCVFSLVIHITNMALLSLACTPYPFQITQNDLLFMWSFWHSPMITIVRWFEAVTTGSPDAASTAQASDAAAGATDIAVAAVLFTSAKEAVCAPPLVCLSVCVCFLTLSVPSGLLLLLPAKRQASWEWPKTF